MATLPTLPSLPLIGSLPALPALPSIPGVPSLPALLELVPLNLDLFGAQTPPATGELNLLGNVLGFDLSGLGLPDVLGLVPAVPTLPALPTLDDVLHSLPSLPTLPSVEDLLGLAHLPSLPSLPSLPGLPSLPSLPSLPTLPSLTNPTALLDSLLTHGVAAGTSFEYHYAQLPLVSEVVSFVSHATGVDTTLGLGLSSTNLLPVLAELPGGSTVAGIVQNTFALAVDGQGVAFAASTLVPLEPITSSLPHAGSGALPTGHLSLLGLTLV